MILTAICFCFTVLLMRRLKTINHLLLSTAAIMCLFLFIREFNLFILNIHKDEVVLPITLFINYIMTFLINDNRNIGS